MFTLKDLKDVHVDIKPIYDKEHPITAAKIYYAKRDLARMQKLEGRGIPRTPKSNAKHPVTDLKYYMDGYLRSNLLKIKSFLKKGYDCVIIVSGNGKVRLGKSTLATQVGYFIAWDLLEERKQEGKAPQDALVPFTNENIVFDPETLMKKASTMPRNSVIVYDEGRAGLDSARAMENINKATVDFFQECGQYGHVVLIVLPDFFKLNETIAVPRSLFLLNVYHDKQYNRGFFSFFNEREKEFLYVIGKKKLGTTQKYMAVDASFYGRFTDYMPIDKDLYGEQKKLALRKKQKTRSEVKWQKHRDAALWLLRSKVKISSAKIAEQVTRISRIQISETMVDEALKAAEKSMELGLMGEELPNMRGVELEEQRT